MEHVGWKYLATIRFNNVRYLQSSSSFSGALIGHQLWGRNWICAAPITTLRIDFRVHLFSIAVIGSTRICYRFKVRSTGRNYRVFRCTNVFHLTALIDGRRLFVAPDGVYFGAASRRPPTASIIIGRRLMDGRRSEHSLRFYRVLLGFLSFFIDLVTGSTHRF